MQKSDLTPLPFDESWPEIEKVLATHRNLVLVAEPGAGKTTRFPAMLIDQSIVSLTGQVAVLEPRRVAARAAALRIASERDWPMKTKVGYTVRFDHQMLPSTSLAFFTEGLFLKKMLSNPTLGGIECVVIDEFHERSRHTDISIAALKELQMLERPDLRIVVMSATIDAEKIANFLSIDSVPAPIVRVPGRTFPIEIVNTIDPLMLSTGRDWVDRVVKSIKHAAIFKNTRRVDILTFLPGRSEIRRVRELLEIDRELTRTYQIFELHGGLALDEQTRVLASATADSLPRIILATNIAETSLTIEGVGTVIDSGLERVSRTDKLGFSQLHLERISMASAKQRSGRAGRLSAGLCYRLWSKQDENSFPQFAEAELKRIDLTDTLLDLYALGIGDPRTFDWFERPDQVRMDQALNLLRDLGAIDFNMRITAIGQQMIKTGLPARAARMMVASRSREISGAAPEEIETWAAIIAGLIGEKDFLVDTKSVGENNADECDLHWRATILFGQSNQFKFDRVAAKTTIRVIESLLGKNAVTPKIATEHWNDKIIAALLLIGFPDRVARRRKSRSPQARMVGGRGIELHPSSCVRASEFFFALKGDAGTSRTSTDPLTTFASSIKKEWIEELAKKYCQTTSNPLFDNVTLTAYSERALMYRDLPLDTGTRDKLDPNDALELLKAEAFDRREELLKQPLLLSFAMRCKFLNRVNLLTANSKLNDEVLENALARAIEEQLYGEISLKTLFTESGAERLSEIWQKILTEKNPDLAKALREFAPSHFIAPTGNRFRIEYPAHQAPFLEVRLQELFGLSVHPNVAGQPLTFHLLAPNFRPVQVTADIPGFWRGSYFEVRKELRARYPKHSWPENPLEATPEARGHRRPKN